MHRRRIINIGRAAAGLAFLLLTSCRTVGTAQQADDDRVISLRGLPLAASAMDSATRARLDADLGKARADLASRPNDPNAWIWVGRRQGYLGEYREAVRTFTEGMRRFPDDPRMYRHRGHRYITIRQLDSAISDFEKAAALMAGRPDEVEPDGQPNARNIPIGSLQSNVWYHLALAHYLKGEWDDAVRAAHSGIAASANPDRLVSQTHWLYMALRRAGKHDEAAVVLQPIRDDFDVIENSSYYELLKLYRRGVSPADLERGLGGGVNNSSNASLAYGLANWFLYTGDTTRALTAFERIVASDQWASFGYIAAEADLARLRRSR
jgi:tetratricopeptide (TPR) repeat protein